MNPSSDPDDDATLVRSLAAHDEVALSRAYDRYGALVYGVATRVLGKVPEAGEVLHDVFLTLWRTAARFEASRGRLAGYVVTLARHRAIDRLRTQRGGPSASASESLGALDLETPSAEGASSRDRFDLAGARARAVAALDTLPAEERGVLEMACFAGLTPSEIADRTGEPLAAVRGRTRNAVRRLRAALSAALGGGR